MLFIYKVWIELYSIQREPVGCELDSTDADAEASLGYWTVPKSALQILDGIPPLECKMEQELDWHTINNNHLIEIYEHSYSAKDLKTYDKQWKHPRPTLTWEHSNIENRLGCTYFVLLDDNALHNVLARLEDYCSQF